MPKTHASKGDWGAVCQVCGFDYKASELKLRWDGLRVCDKDFELRHPADLYQGPTGSESIVPWTSPEVPDITIAVTFTGGTSTPLLPGTNNGDL